MRDLIFKEENFVFSYRVAGVVVQNGRVLMQKEPHDDGHAFPGGHVSLGETHAQTLLREFQEELHADISVGRLMAVGEVFFPWGKQPCHQICLYYEVSLDDPGQMPGTGIFHGWDDLGNERVNLDFLWVEVKDLPRIPVYPPEMAQYLAEGREDVIHFVYNEFEEENPWTK